MTNAQPDVTEAGFRVLRFGSRMQMAEAAAADIAAHLRDVLARQEEARIIVASAPSQEQMITALANAPDVDWSRVVAFHMDEYIGLPPDHPERFGNWLRQFFFNRVPLKRFHVIAPDADKPEAEAQAYAALLAEAPIDLITLGIGVNGHIAFNDPPVADFNDPLGVKVVELDEQCRQQQVDDGCFPSLSAVPARAVTVTVTGLLAGRKLFTVVPGRSKREAVRQALHGPISTACPASILRTHPDCTLYLDPDADPDG